MADGLSREEKLAAGLKKLKQFQQRTAKSKGLKKKPNPPKENSLEDNISDVKTVESKVNRENNLGVKSLNEASENNLEQSKNKSSSNSMLTNSAYNSLINLPDKETSISSIDDRSIEDIYRRSKSELDLSNTKTFSSAESLHQIALQVNGLMSESQALLNGSIEQELSPNAENQNLERRNQELTSLVNNLQQSNDHLQFQLEELKAKNKRLVRDFEKEKKDLSERSFREQASLKDQLQVHIQTIGILVAEKTELQSSLSLSQQTAKQKAGEVEELQGRLRACRQRTSDLERDLNALENSRKQFEEGNKNFVKEIERLKLDNYKLNKSVEEFRQANAELTEKFTKKISENQRLEKELLDCRGKLSIAEMSNSISNENQNQLEEVYQQKLELEKKISLHKESIDKLINERDQMSEQYQLYIQQLSQQVTSLRDEIKQLINEKDALFKEKNLLEEKLEALQHSNDNMNKDDIVELKRQMSILENQKFELNEQLQDKDLSTNEMKEKLEKQEEEISNLEKAIKRLQEEKVDQSRLVEAMQSDKVAASRAVAQNRELKKQLEELQDGFVSLSNDKLELAEKLNSEQHITKELGERLSQQEEELQELRDQLSQKEVEIQNLHKSNTKGIYHQNQIVDRMRHYEAKGQLTEMLQKDLRQALEKIDDLLDQNSELRMAIARQAEHVMNDENQKEDKDASKRNDLVASLSASVRQLEMERNQMMIQLEEQKLHRSNLEEQMKKKEIEIHADETNNDVVSKEEYAIMKKAMEQLEERFKQTMNKIAELSDERQQLEHLVLQLQGETDTIGDYIALYQIQRGLMRKRASEKDDYIAQLARDREDLKTKLGELQNLVIRLLEERKQLQSQGSIQNAIPKPSDLLQVAKEATTRCEGSVPFNEELIYPTVDTKPEHLAETSKPEKPEATAKKIMDLLTEIGTTNLIEKPVLDNFHPCPLCSGRLITV